MSLKFSGGFTWKAMAFGFMWRKNKEGKFMVLFLLPFLAVQVTFNT